MEYKLRASQRERERERKWMQESMIERKACFSLSSSAKRLSKMIYSFDSGHFLFHQFTLQQQQHEPSSSLFFPCYYTLAIYMHQFSSQKAWAEKQR